MQYCTLCANGKGDTTKESHPYSALPKVRGRIYIETSDTLQAFELLKNSPYVYWSNMYLVGREEHVELLSPNQVPKDIEINSWVRIRSGLYRKDIGQVVAMNYNAEFYSVLVVPRIPPPVPARKLTKQARSQKDRPQPQRLRKKDAIRKYGKGTVKKLEGDEFEEDDFQFKKNRYNKRGLRYLRFHFDAIEVVKPTLQDLHAFLDAAIEQITEDHEDPEMNDDGSMWRTPHTDDEVFHVANIKLHHLALETFINVGTEVEVAWGDQQGRIGRVVSVSTNGLITVGDETDSVNSGSRATVEVNARALRPVFNIGDSVAVKYGVLSGRMGLVENIDGFNVIVRDASTKDEVKKKNTIRAALKLTTLIYRCAFGPTFSRKVV